MENFCGYHSRLSTPPTIGAAFDIHITDGNGRLVVVADGSGKQHRQNSSAQITLETLGIRIKGLHKDTIIFDVAPKILTRNLLAAEIIPLFDGISYRFTAGNAIVFNTRARSIVILEEHPFFIQIGQHRCKTTLVSATKRPQQITCKIKYATGITYTMTTSVCTNKKLQLAMPNAENSEEIANGINQNNSSLVRRQPTAENAEEIANGINRILRRRRPNGGQPTAAEFQSPRPIRRRIVLQPYTVNLSVMSNQMINQYITAAQNPDDLEQKLVGLKFLTHGIRNDMEAINDLGVKLVNRCNLENEQTSTT